MGLGAHLRPPGSHGRPPCETLDKTGGLRRVKGPVVGTVRLTVRRSAYVHTTNPHLAVSPEGRGNYWAQDITPDLLKPTGQRAEWSPV